MTCSTRIDTAFPQDLPILDDLIARYYRELLKSVEEQVKLGDLLKMIELRRKLQPDDQSQKQFWSMLDDVRQKELKPNQNAVRQDGTVTASTTKVATKRRARKKRKKR
ncbi:MAG: hypothetical protein ACE5FH_11755 [Candidatus Zixiibacteriota bacterium]